MRITTLPPVLSSLKTRQIAWGTTEDPANATVLPVAPFVLTDQIQRALTAELRVLVDPQTAPESRFEVPDYTIRGMNRLLGEQSPDAAPAHVGLVPALGQVSPNERHIYYAQPLLALAILVAKARQGNTTNRHATERMEVRDKRTHTGRKLIPRELLRTMPNLVDALKSQDKVRLSQVADLSRQLAAQAPLRSDLSAHFTTVAAVLGYLAEQSAMICFDARQDAFFAKKPPVSVSEAKISAREARERGRSRRTPRTGSARGADWGGD